MNQLELIEKELRNNDNTLFHIYLYNEGDWWRAYEWSAYLCTHMNMTDGLILKPTHKNLKGSDTGMIEIDVTNNIINNENINIDNYKTIFNEWKFSVPIEFLGAFIKPNRTYISNACLQRIKKRLNDYEYHPYNINIVNSINSFLGIFSHYKSFNIRKNLSLNMKLTKDIGIFNELFTKFIP